MRSHLIPSFSLVSACFLLLASASPARAQCGVNTIGFGNVGIVTGNSFHAEIVATRTGLPKLMSPIPGLPPESVARDGQGRVRSERVAGPFKRDSGDETGSKVEEHLITICDPVAQTITKIDTMNATAEIIHSRPSAPSQPSPTHRRTFCSSRLPSNRNSNPNMTVEDLGDRTIEGVEAHGERIIMKPMLAPTGNGDPSPGESVTTIWCSDELSAVVLRITENTKSGFKSSVAMRNIERTVPDPALFQIPEGYAVTETLQEPRGLTKPAEELESQP
jgi:hypothetical protein